jgi:hypothetical protein
VGRAALFRRSFAGQEPVPATLAETDPRRQRLWASMSAAMFSLIVSFAIRDTARSSVEEAKA